MPPPIRGGGIITVAVARYTRFDRIQRGGAEFIPVGTARCRSSGGSPLPPPHHGVARLRVTGERSELDVTRGSNSVTADAYRYSEHRSMLNF